MKRGGETFTFGEGCIFLMKNLPLGRSTLHRTGNQVKAGLLQEVIMAVPRTVHICKAV